MTLAQEKLEQRLNSMVNTQIRDLRGKVLDVETSTDKLLARFSETLDDL